MEPLGQESFEPSWLLGLATMVKVGRSIPVWLDNGEIAALRLHDTELARADRLRGVLRAPTRSPVSVVTARNMPTQALSQDLELVLFALGLHRAKTLFIRLKLAQRLSPIFDTSSTPSTPQQPSKTPQIPSNRDHKALNRGTLGGLGL